MGLDDGDEFPLGSKRRPLTRGSTPKSLIVDLARYFGGAEVRVLDLAAALGPEGCRVACLRGSPLAQRLRTAGQRPLEVATRKTDPRIGAILAREAQRGGFAVVDAQNIQSRLWCSGVWGRQRGPVLVATVHSSLGLEHAGRFKGRFYELLERWTIPKAARIITVSESLRTELLGWAVAAERISVVPNGVREEPVAPEAGLAVRREFGLRPDDQVVGAIGRLEPAKGLIHLLEAVAALAPAWPRLKCLLVGEGRLDRQLRAFAAGHGIGDRAVFAGFRSDVPRILAALDIFALPSLTEGIPFALLEAGLAARPVVASRVGGVPEVLVHESSGLLVDPADVPSLAAAIGSLLNDPGRARHLGRQAAETVRRRFGLPAMVEGTRQAYATALGHRAERRA
ncbi:MAG: glycosyltransferase family 4 protein [Candidatus Methylomirabilia bacterium]